MRRRPALLLLVAGLCLLVGLSLFVRHLLLGREEVVTLKVWVGQKSILHLPLYVALEEGYFTEQGVKVLLTLESSGDSSYPNQAAAADLVLTDPAPYLFYKAIKPGLPPVVAVVASRDGSFLLGREKEDFAWGNLKGKRIISQPPETGPGLALEKKLRDSGLAPYMDTGLYNRIPADLRLGTFKSGSGDYIQLDGMAALAAEAGGTGSIVSPVGQKEEIFPSVICTASRETIKNNPGAVQGFVNGLYKAQLYMHREPGLGLSAAEKFLDKTERRMAPALLEKYAALDMWAPQPWMDAEVFDALVQVMGTSGQLPAPVNYNDTVNNTFALQAAETVQYIPPEERNRNWLQKLFS